MAKASRPYRFARKRPSLPGDEELGVGRELARTVRIEERIPHASRPHGMDLIGYFVVRCAVRQHSDARLGHRIAVVQFSGHPFEHGAA